MNGTIFLDRSKRAHWRRWLALVLVLVIGAGAWWYYGGGGVKSAVTRAPDPAKPGDKRRVTTAGRVEAIPVPRERLSALAISAGVNAKESPYAWHRSSRDPIGPRVQHLLDSNDPAALRTAVDLVVWCWASYSPLSLAQSTSRLSGEALEKQTSAVATVKQRCGDIPQALLDRTSKIRMELRHLGDLRARVDSESQDPRFREALASDLRAALNAGDLDAAYLAVDFFARQRFEEGGPGSVKVVSGDGFLAVSIDTTIATFHIDGTPYLASQIRDAFLLAQCDLGFPCDRRNAYVMNGCVMSGWCTETTDEQLAARYAQNLPQVGMTPDRLPGVYRLRDIIIRSMGTGSWPAGFWTLPPIPAPKPWR